MRLLTDASRQAKRVFSGCMGLSQFPDRGDVCDQVKQGRSALLEMLDHQFARAGRGAPVHAAHGFSGDIVAQCAEFEGLAKPLCGLVAQGVMGHAHLLRQKTSLRARQDQDRNIMLRGPVPCHDEAKRKPAGQYHLDQVVVTAAWKADFGSDLMPLARPHERHSVAEYRGCGAPLPVRFHFDHEGRPPGAAFYRQLKPGCLSFGDFRRSTGQDMHGPQRDPGQ